MSISDFVISWIRTAVPAGVGFVLTWLSVNGDFVLSDSDSAGTVAVVVALVTAAYYAVARALETRWPAFGALLGVARQPVYPAAPKAVHRGPEL